MKLVAGTVSKHKKLTTHARLPEFIDVFCHILTTCIARLRGESLGDGSALQEGKECDCEGIRLELPAHFLFLLLYLPQKQRVR